MGTGQHTRRDSLRAAGAGAVTPATSPPAPMAFAGEGSRKRPKFDLYDL